MQVGSGDTLYRIEWEGEFCRVKNKLFYVFLVVIFVAGLSLLLYPTISNAYNAWLQSKAIAEYAAQIDSMDGETSKAEKEKAQAFNAALLQRTDPFSLTDELLEQYQNTLSVTNDNIIAYVQIPSIDVMLPIAHGTSEDVLKDKIGHLEWSSLPVGGDSTHCVISGHRGLPSSELFTNIDHLELGDKFFLHVLGETLEYQVCHITVVEPDDQRLLRIEEGQDLVTLVTCTPYGINSHRLLVRGIRVDGQSGDTLADMQIKNEITIVDVLVLVAVVFVAVAVITFVVVLLRGTKKKGGRQDENSDT